MAKSLDADLCEFQSSIGAHHHAFARFLDEATARNWEEAEMFSLAASAFLETAMDAFKRACHDHADMMRSDHGQT